LYRQQNILLRHWETPLQAVLEVLVLLFYRSHKKDLPKPQKPQTRQTSLPISYQSTLCENMFNFMIMLLEPLFNRIIP
jgi:hypothetical protein